MRGTETLLYSLRKRFINLNAHKVSEYLNKEIDSTKGARFEVTIFRNVVCNPYAWCISRDFKYYNEEFQNIIDAHTNNKKREKDRTTTLTNGVEMTISQFEVFKALTINRIQIVWGPPGSGKTYFSAAYWFG